MMSMHPSAGLTCPRGLFLVVAMESARCGSHQPSLCPPTRPGARRSVAGGPDALRRLVRGWARTPHTLHVYNETAETAAHRRRTADGQGPWALALHVQIFAVGHGYPTSLRPRPFNIFREQSMNSS